MKRYTVRTDDSVGYVYYEGTDSYIAENTYKREKNQGQPVELVQREGRVVLRRTRSHARLELLTPKECCRCGLAIPVSGTVPAVDLKGGPVCGACEKAEKAQARATWLKGVVPA